MAKSVADAVSSFLASFVVLLVRSPEELKMGTGYLILNDYNTSSEFIHKRKPFQLS